MSPKPRGKSAGWKPPRDRREVVTAVLASLTVIVITAALVWFLRPNREAPPGIVNPLDRIPSAAVDGSTTTTVAPTTSTP